MLLVGGECFTWRPWLGSSNGNGNTDKEELKKKMVNKKGQFEVDESVWGLLGVVWPRPGMSTSFSPSLQSDPTYQLKSQC